MMHQDELRAARQGNACVMTHHLTLAPLYKGFMMHQEDVLRAAHQGNACLMSRHLTLAPLHKG